MMLHLFLAGVIRDISGQVISHNSIYLTCNNVHMYIYINTEIYTVQLQYMHMTPSIPCISFRGPLSIPYLELKLAPVFTEKGLLLRGTNPILKMKCIPVV